MMGLNVIGGNFNEKHLGVGNVWLQILRISTPLKKTIFEVTLSWHHDISAVMTLGIILRGLCLNISLFIVNIIHRVLFYTQIHFIHISLAECYNIFNYKDQWDPGLFTCYTLLYNILKWCCISWPAIGCSVLYISTSYRVLVIHTSITIFWIILCKFFFLSAHYESF